MIGRSDAMARYGLLPRAPMRWLTACLVAAGISVFGLTAQEKLEGPP